ncbi:Histidine phosphatase superfamily clade 1 [uncultured virus]|nr:Histidine phosphatase superfamily clade 1 [uncultured virus]
MYPGPLVIFVRHGESQSNKLIHDNLGIELTPEQIHERQDPELTELGVKQAARTAEYLYQRLESYGSDVKVHVWVSPFARTRETAHEFITRAENMVVEYEEFPWLQEHTFMNKALSQSLIAKALVVHKS